MDSNSENGCSGSHETKKTAKKREKGAQKKESSGSLVDNSKSSTNKQKTRQKSESSDDDNDDHKGKPASTKTRTSNMSESESSEDDMEKTVASKQKTRQKQWRPKEFSKKNVPRIVLLGATGAGKSHLGNTLLGEIKFKVSDAPESCTSEASECIRGFWLGHEDEFEIIDTPGMNDSEGRDTLHIQNIVENLRDYKFVNTFLIVRNGHELRMTNTYSDMLRTFEMIFGDNFWKHAMFDVSGKLSKKEVKSAKQWIDEIRSRFPNARKVKTVFLDADNQNEDFEINVKDLWDSAIKMKKFGCKDIKVVLEEKERLQQEKDELAIKKEEATKKIEELKEAQSHEVDEFEIKLREAKEENKAELQTLKDKVNDKDNELNRMGFDKKAEVMKKDFEIELMEKDKSLKEQFEQEKKELIEQYELKIDAKIKEEKENDLEKKQHEQGLLDQISELKRKNEFSEVSADIIQKHKKEIETWEGIVREKEKDIKLLEDKIHAERDLKLQQEAERRQKKEEKEKADLVKKTEAYEQKENLSDKEFMSKYPSLSSINNDESPTPAVSLCKEAKRIGITGRFERDVQIPLKQRGDVKNRMGGIAARIFETKYQDSEGRNLSNLWGMTGLTKKSAAIQKSIMILGLTGSGKTTFIDSLINYIFDVRYQDENRLKLIQMTKDESAKATRQAVSQTDHIVVYNIGHLSSMNIDYDLTIVDTPGFGDTRGVDYDKKLMQNIEDLFKSKKISTLDAIGFVAKAGDARLTAQQNYIFESIMHIFGKDVENNLISILTNYDGQTINILDSFKEANMNFVKHFPINSAAIFQSSRGNARIDKSILTSAPTVAQYQQFFNQAHDLTKTLHQMAPKSLEQTITVLNDRESIQVELQGVQERIMELLMKKNLIQKETDICKQHTANASANKDSEYEVEEHEMHKIQLSAGTYVTNCLKCNMTCHYPCSIPNDDGKAGCAAMRKGVCTVCKGKCHWEKHVNTPHRFEFKTVKVKKTYEEIIARHADFIKKHNNQKTVVDALQAEADAASQEIQESVPRIQQCLARLQENALRPNMSSSVDYLEQMIRTEDHERKPGYLDRISQLRKEKDKARMLSAVQEGKEITQAKN